MYDGSMDSEKTKSFIKIAIDEKILVVRAAG
jgi:hypothetical protein